MLAKSLCIWPETGFVAVTYPDTPVNKRVTNFWIPTSPVFGYM